MNLYSMLQHIRQITSTQQNPQPNYVPLNGEVIEDNRKFAEKPNALKKVALDDIDDDLQTNQIQDGGFSWANMLGKEFFGYC